MKENPNIRYLIYDIESITDKNLLQKVLYPELSDKPEEAFQKHLSELAEEGRDFINPSFHRPISIAVLSLNADFEISKIGLLGRREETPEENSEENSNNKTPNTAVSTRTLVEHFWELYQDYRPTLVDFNGKGFDLRVMELWAFRLGIVLPKSYFEKFGARYRFQEDSHLDLHEFLTNYGAIRYRGGLNLFSKILGKPGKMETQGHMVQEMFDAGEHFKIDDYCLADAADTYFVFLRTLVMRGRLSLVREQALVEAAQEKLLEMSKTQGYFKDYLKHFSLWDPQQA